MDGKTGQLHVVHVRVTAQRIGSHSVGLLLNVQLSWVAALAETINQNNMQPEH